ncbi:beta strand repeat-containing protein [Lacipirellula sp.]|uniref:beta strand repeat-containing protein n=1 Tax=Lacipirellula sp. TaxID=2691419 RepID=UPI003D0D1DD3
MSSCFNGDWHGRHLGLTAAMLALLACGSSANAQSADGLPFESSASGRIYNGTTPLRLWHQTRGYGMEASQTAFGGRMAVDLVDAIGFLDGQFRVSNESQFGMDFGGGFRWMAPSLLTGDTRVFGLTGWYDGQETTLNNYYNQLGVSFESLGEQIDFRVNANIPLENVKSGDTVITTDTISYSGNFLSIATLIPSDVALRVVDFEAAPRIFDLNAWIYAGGYQMDGDNVSEMGAKGGVRGYVTNDLAVDVGVQDDDLFGTNTVFQVIWTPGRTGAGPTSWVHTLADRMREQVYRNNYIATTQVQKQGAINLTDVDGQDIRIVHVDFTSSSPGDGTVENPYTSINSANGTGSQQGDIILVHAQTGANVYAGQSLSLQDEQRFLGEGGGVSHTVVTQQMGTVTLPETFAGALNATRPTMQNSSGSAAVTLAGSNQVSEAFAQMEVSNFTFDGGASAIISGTNGVAAVNINNLDVKNTTSHGIDLADMTQTLANGTTRSRFAPTINKVTFDNVGGDDIRLTSTTSETTISHATAISNITSTNGHGVGINLQQNQRAATINNFDWNGGTTGTGGLLVFEAGTQGSVTLSNSANADDNVITGGLVGTAYAIKLDNSAATHTVTGTKIQQMGGDSIVVNDGAANLNFTGEISQTTNAQSVLSVTGGHTGTLTFVELTANNGVINATTGDGLQFDDADGNYIFTDTVKLTGTSQAINVVDSDGTLTFQDAQITDTTGTAIAFSGGEASMTLTGKVTQTTNATVLNVTNEHNGTLTFNELTANAGVINATNGNGLQFDNANGAYIFNDKVTLAGATPVINVNAADDAATFTFSEVDIDYSGAGSAVTIANSDLQAFTISGDIDVASGGGRPVTINNNTGGSITFNTTIDSTQNGILVTGNSGTTIRFAGQTTLNTGANNAVTLTNNTTGGVRFDAIDITTTGAGTGFVASNTANLTVQGTGNTITTANGVALSLTDVEVGSAGVTFQSVTSTGGGTAVVLDDVTGGTVTINGGSLTNQTGDAIAVIGGANLAVNNMTITGSGGDGINIDLTTNVASTISVANTVINNTGALGIDYNRGSLVTNTTRLTLTGNTIDTTADQNVHIDINGSGTANVTVNGANQFTNSSNDEALLITTSGGASKTVNLLVDGSTFSNNDTTAAAARIQTNGAGTVNATVTNNNFDNSTATTGRALTVRTNSSATMRLNLNDNNGNSGTEDPFNLERVSGTFRVEDLATVEARNNGAMDISPTITNDAGPIPTP